MELARVFSSPDVKTERSIRFALWNNEEIGLNGAKLMARISERTLQGKENARRFGFVSRAKVAGHDPARHDATSTTACRTRTRTMSKDQRPEADVNVEYAMTAKMADPAMLLAHKFQLANEKYATDYPANIGPHMTNTDSDPFKDLTAAISLRELERGSQIGNGWDPHHHQPTDVFTTFSDDDFRLGLNAAQTTLRSDSPVNRSNAEVTPAVEAAGAFLYLIAANNSLTAASSCASRPE